MSDLRSTIEQAPRPLYFGDSQEFLYGGCAEEVSNDGEISELTIFFRGSEGLYGLAVERTDHDGFREASVDEEDLPPAIETTHVDPALVVNILRLPSAKILELAVQLPEEQS